MKHTDITIEKINLLDKNLQELKRKIVTLGLNEDTDLMYLIHTFEKSVLLIKQERFNLAYFWFEQAKLFISKVESLAFEKLGLKNVCLEIQNALNYFQKE